MTYLTPSRNRLLAVGLSLAGLLVLATATSARAADTVYWADFGSNRIAFANLAGGGAGYLDITGASGIEANGVAIDSAAGRVYWVTAAPPKVYFANLAGGGGGELNIAGATTTGFAVGDAVDPGLGRVYWANGEKNKISYANLNGSGGGDLDTTGATVRDPLGVVVDPNTGRVYWANGEPEELATTEKISYANLTGGGGGDLNTSGATVDEPAGVAIDSTTGRIYWGNYLGNSISYANLNGTGGGDLPTTGKTAESPFGVSVDPTAGRVYWTAEVPGKIAYASTTGSGGSDLDTTGVTPNLPAFPIILKAPSALAAPKASGSVKPGSTLTCTPGTWAPDLIESFLYRAPQSTATEWLKNGQPVAGATTTSLKASAVGDYSCRSSATNHAGSASQTSAPVAVFKLGKVKPNKKKGTATISVQVPGAGTLKLSGKKVAKQSKKRSASSPATIKLLVKAKGKANKALNKKGKAKVKVSVQFTPLGGSGGTQAKTLTLKKKLSG